MSVKLWNVNKVTVAFVKLKNANSLTVALVKWKNIVIVTIIYVKVKNAQNVNNFWVKSRNGEDPVGSSICVVLGSVYNKLWCHKEQISCIKHWLSQETCYVKCILVNKREMCFKLENIKLIPCLLKLRFNQRTFCLMSKALHQLIPKVSHYCFMHCQVNFKFRYSWLFDTSLPRCNE